jgi:segregation and condensation protein B
MLRNVLFREGHGIAIVESPGGWRMSSSEDVADIVAVFRDTAMTQKIRLSKAAVETLAVIAYNQPVTRSEVEDIRGVRCERVIETLLSHGMIRIAGRRKGTGSPLLYRTTERFLEVFGVASISELPTLEELDELAPPENPGFGENSGESCENGSAAETTGDPHDGED